MTTEIVLTGTGYPRPHRDRAGPGVLVRRGDCVLQFDAGRATAMRLAAAGVSCLELSAVFLTHHHSDHLMDLADLAITRWAVGDSRLRYSPLPVVAPDGPATRFAERLLDVWADDIDIRAAQSGREVRPEVDCASFTASAEPAEIWSEGEVSVSAIAVHHEPVVPAVAYRVDSPDGAVVISGDTRACAEIVQLADGADVLIHEVIRGGVLRGWGIVGYHAESRELGKLLAETDVPLLVLTHLIPTPETPDDERTLVEEVRSGGYRGEIVVGRDLTRIELPRVPDRR